MLYFENSILLHGVYKNAACDHLVTTNEPWDEANTPKGKEKRHKTTGCFGYLAPPHLKLCVSGPFHSMSQYITFKSIWIGFSVGYTQKILNQYKEFIPTTLYINLLNFITKKSESIITVPQEDFEDLGIAIYCINIAIKVKTSSSVIWKSFMFFTTNQIFSHEEQ